MHWVIGGCFFLSGACGLIYQVLWLRLLGLVFGVTVYAASTVWASFMAGLALGSIIGGRVGDRVRRPLLWFGIAEALVGVSALATPAVLGALQHLYVPLQASLVDTPWALTLVRLTVSFLVLAVPTMLMGASLPLIVKGIMTRDAALGGRAGALYAANTAGAIAGTLIAGLALIPGVGITRTFWIAAAANALIGVVAIAVGVRAVNPEPRTRNPEPGTPEPGTPEPRTPEPRNPGTLRVRRVVLSLFFVSGVASLALEVIWFRMIVLIVRPTVYAFSLMLASVLAGIALGSAIVAPMMRKRRDWPFVLAVVNLLTGAAALLSLTILNHTATLQAWFGPIFSRVLPDYLTYTVVTAIPAVLPASLLLGVAFPIGLHIWAGTDDDGDRVASDVGVFYAVNVTGAILGSLAAGFVLLPLLGSRVSLIVTAGAFVLGGLVLLAVRQPSPRRALVPAIAVTAVFAIGAVLVDDPFDAFLRVRYPRDRVIMRTESVQTTVSVHRTPDGRLSMHLEGNHQASDHPTMAGGHQRMGHLPLAVHPDPRSALVIGLGGGATAGAVAVDPDVHVTVVELSRAVVRGAGYFSHINYSILSRPNVEVRVDDGRNVLLTTDKKFDIVTADVVLPIHAGSNNLYSREYFQLVRNVLAPGGVFLQWVAGTEAEYHVITRTFLSVFPDATAWLGGELLIGSTGPLELSRAAFDRKMATPGRLPAFKALGVATFEDLLRLYRAGAPELRQLVGEGAILTDDRPLVEYFLSLSRERDADLSQLRGDVSRHVSQQDMKDVKGMKE